MTKIKILLKKLRIAFQDKWRSFLRRTKPLKTVKRAPIKTAVDIGRVSHEPSTRKRPKAGVGNINKRNSYPIGQIRTKIIEDELPYGDGD
jgi:hypothetical protein